MATIYKMITELESAGIINTHYFNGNGITNKTNSIIRALNEKGFVKDVDYEVINVEKSILVWTRIKLIRNEKVSTLC